jgi:hypothetical protein
MTTGDRLDRCIDLIVASCCVAWIVVAAVAYVDLVVLQ